MSTIKRFEDLEKSLMVFFVIYAPNVLNEHNWLDDLNVPNGHNYLYHLNDPNEQTQTLGLRLIEV